MTRKSLIAALLISSNAHAGLLLLSFGPTINGTIGEKKVLTAGYEYNWGAPSLKLDAGTWNVNGGMAFYGALNFGVHVISSGGLTTRIGFGPAVISQTDERLSSNFEFNIQARIGLNMGGWEAGLNALHLSNAGIKLPNLGRDIVGIYIGVPL